MNPTYWENEEVRVMAHGPLNRWEVVVFHPPMSGEETSLYLKRVVGLPGEHIAYQNGLLYINGSIVEDSFSELTENFDLTEAFGYQVIPEDSYFVLGDNRGISEDSRRFGVVHKKNIVGIIAKE